MDNILSVLTPEEYVYLKLRALYSGYGYKKYRMSKFEEYDLYAKNKDFLVSESVITFTDMGGKLLALKPDVTLSIVKNSKDVDGVMKVYYNENVYRVSKGTKTFKEIMQTGLECIGAVDLKTVEEVLLLASKSLSEISKDYMLCVSNLDIIKEVLGFSGLSVDKQNETIKYLGEKNETLVCFAKEYVKTKPIDFFIFGHRHVVLDLMITKSSRVVYLGDWVTNFSYGVLDGTAFSLEIYEDE